MKCFKFYSLTWHHHSFEEEVGFHFENVGFFVEEKKNEIFN